MTNEKKSLGVFTLINSAESGLKFPLCKRGLGGFLPESDSPVLTKSPRPLLRKGETRSRLFELNSALFFLFFLYGCSASSGNNSATSSPSNADTPKPTSSSADTVVKPNLTNIGDAAVGEDAIPQDPVTLKNRAKAELAAGNLDAAMSMIDVLLVLNPDDLELIEIRGNTMMKQGLKEDATVDLRRCCEKGRASCCQ